MEKKSFTLLCLLLGTLSSFAQRINIPVAQTDPRFTLSVQRSSSIAGGSEYYYFYVQNNTNREYELNVNITLELACAGIKTISLRSGILDVLHLLPGGRYNSENQAQFIYFGKKECAVPLGNNSYTLYKGISCTISNIVDISSEKEESEAKKKAADQAKAKAAADAKTQKEQQLLNQQKNAESTPAGLQASQSVTAPKNSTAGSSNAGLSEKVKVNGQYVQVFRQNGLPYVRNADGSYYQTSEEAYSRIMSSAAKNTPVSSNQEAAQQQDSQALKFTQDYARNQQYQAERTEIITKGVTDLGNLVGGWIQQNQADKARKEALEEQRAEEERQRQYALYLKTSSRKNAFAELPSKDIPLSSQDKAPSIYYFIYSYSNLESEYGASAYISNVFEIGRYNDGTRAYTATVKNDIANLSPYAEVLHGYYYTAQQAEQKRQELIAVLQNTGVAVNTIFYKGKGSAAKSGSAAADKQESSYGTVISAAAKVDMRPNNGTAPKPKADNSKESQAKNYGTIIK
ncbi:hypothetical protein ASE21_21430 [Flavobacterium sp. Root901]|nr:hypothetical protein ASE21_21430 [Flavobacterium sp. Root901]